MHLDAALELIVDRSPEQVFDVIDDHRNLPRILAKTALVPGVVRCDPLPGPERGLGSRSGFS